MDPIFKSAETENKIFNQLHNVQHSSFACIFNNIGIRHWYLILLHTK